MQKNIYIYLLIFFILLNTISCALLPGTNKAENANVPVIAGEIIPSSEPSVNENETLISACSINDVILHLESTMSYDLAEVFYTGYGNADSSVLNVWIVDSEIEPQADHSAIPMYVGIAKQHAVDTIQEFLFADACLPILFPAGITVQVVDQQFNSWYLGNTVTTEIEENKDDNVFILDHLADFYTRNTPIDASKQLSDPASTFEKMHEEFDRQFGSAPNNFMYISIDEEYGLMVSTQFQMSDDVINYAEESQEKMVENISIFGMTGSANALFVTSYMDPQPDLLYTSSVDQNGNMLYLGYVDQDESQQLAIENIHVLFPTQTANNSSQLMGLFCSITLAVDTNQQISFTDCSEVGNYFINLAGENYSVEQFKDTQWVVDNLNQYFEMYHYPLQAEAMPVITKENMFQRLQMENTYEIALAQLPNFYHALFILGWNESSEYQLIDFMNSNYQDISTETLFYETYGVSFEDAWIGTIEITKIEPN